MSGRNIHPSGDVSQTSSVSPPGSYTGPAGGDSSVSGGGGQAGGQGGSHGGGSGALAERRRRAPTYVTQNACLNCKKARAKVCFEECSRGVIVGIHNADRAARSGLVTVQWAQAGRSVAERLGRPPFADLPDLSPTSHRQLTDLLMDYDKDAGGDRDSESGIRHDGEWTSVTSDHGFIDHLFSLYFTWVHPVHMLFSRNHFLSSYRNQSNLYCSSALVNAICAMGCLLMGEKGKYSAEDGFDPEKLRTQFMKESNSLIKPEHYNKTTVLQTFAVMSLVELRHGQGARASSYIRLAGDAMNSSREDRYSTEAMEITKWGIYALKCCWGQYTYQVPVVLQVPSPYDPPDFNVDGHSCLWRFYRDANDEDIPERPSSTVMAASEFAQLMRLVHDNTILFYDVHESKVKARGVLDQYQKYLEWKDDLPQDLADIDDDDQMVPHVLSLHIQYYAAMVLLFRPLLHLEALPEATMNHLRSLTVDYAWQGFEIQRRYRRLFTCRYQPSLQNFSLLHFTDALFRFAPSKVDGKEIVGFCLEALRESANGHGGFAAVGPLQEMLRRCAVECGVPMPENLDDLMIPGDYGPDRLLDACTRLSYTQPINQIVSGIDEEVAQTFAEEWRKFVEGPQDDESDLSEKSLGEKFMKIGSLLNE